MINRAIKELVVKTAGDAAWEDIAAAAYMNADNLLDSVVYDDAVTYRLVEAVSSRLAIPAEEVLVAVGRHWILFTGQEGWGPMFTAAGRDLRTFVANLDALHSRVQSSLPACRMPSFRAIDRPDGTLEVRYTSEREGLAPMVTGLLQGLVEHFGESWAVGYARRDDDGAHLFELTPMPAKARESSGAAV
jgi:hypothetical protein